MYEPHYGIEIMSNSHGETIRHHVNHCRQSTNRIHTMIAIIITILISGCAITPLIVNPIDNTRLNNGIYQGYFKGGLNSARVEVSIHAGEIIDIIILEHDTLKGKKAEEIIINEILEKQSTDVDAVSGATNSSHVIINATQIALEKALSE